MIYEGWEGGTPPKHWPRLLAFDVGGATANALEFAAQDPVSLCLVFYDEVHKITTSMREVAKLALPKMKHPDGSEYQWIAKVGDYENRIALDDMAKYGIRFTNAVKQNKIKSVHRLASYLHPNELRPFPIWHPNAGRLGSPLVFITQTCKHLIEELPQQRWKNERVGDSLKDELDRGVKHDAVDCALYITRILPAPETIPVPKVSAKGDSRSLQSKLYWADVKRQQEKKNDSEKRKAYNPGHCGGGDWKSLLGF